MQIKFHPSYPLDLLSFLDQIIWGAYDETLESDLEYFRGFISFQGEESIKFLKKTIGESLLKWIGPLLVCDPDFLNYSIHELLAPVNHLIKNFKKDSSYKAATKEYRYFIKKEVAMVISSLEPLIQDMERANFKLYWLKNHLPQIREAIDTFASGFLCKNVAGNINFLTHLHYTAFVCGLSAHENNDLGNGCLLVSKDIPNEMILENILEKALTPHAFPICWENILKEIDKTQKLKKIKPKGIKLSVFVQQNLLLAIKCFLKEKFGLTAHGRHYLLGESIDSENASLLFFDYFEKNSKPFLTLEAYLLEMIAELEIQLVNRTVNTHSLKATDMR